MSQASSRKQRRAPQRLSWPTSLSLSQGSVSSLGDTAKTTQTPWQQIMQRHSTSDSETNIINGRKRPRTSIETVPSSEKKDRMWVEKYTPTTIADVCIAPKKVKEMQEWLRNSTSIAHHDQRYQGPIQRKKLLILVGSPGIGKSTTIRVIAKELNRPIFSWNESFIPRGFQGMDSRGLFTLEQTSALDSFNEFLEQSGSSIASLDLTSSQDKMKTTINNGIILLEELPNLHGVSAELRFREMMSRHIQRSQVPTILIFSDVSEGKHRPEDLERIIDPDILYNNDKTSIMQIHSVTKPKMKKVIGTIAKREGFQFHKDFLEELHHQSQGDIRHAIMTLQLYATGNTNQPHAISSLGKKGQNERDTKLSTFHSLGKLLYAKRFIDEEGRSRLAFDPEKILERSDLELDGSLRFLEYHSLDFYTDIMDLSNAYSSFSDASSILETDISSGWSNRYDRSSIFPLGCASAIAGRTVANTNFHPAPNKFRQFSRPKVFDVLRNGRQNQILIDQLSRRLSTNGRRITTNTCTTSFVTEALPYVRKIKPEEVDPYLDNLYSVATQNYQDRVKSRLKSHMDEEEIEFQKEQATLLQMDDIEDFDSD